MKQQSILPDGRYELRQGDRVKIVEAEDLHAKAAVFFEPEPEPVPEAVTARQARLALLGAGVLPMVESALTAIPGVEGEAARIEWEYALEIRRDSPLIGALAPMLGLTDGQVDDLFRAALGL
ncbi:MAG: hypothetical protein ACRCTO_09420 [Pseudomonas paracarnis]